MFWLVILWILFSLCVAALADERGHNPLLWLVASLLIDPILAFLLLFLMENDD